MEKILYLLEDGTAFEGDLSVTRIGGKAFAKVNKIVEDDGVTKIPNDAITYINFDFIVSIVKKETKEINKQDVQTIAEFLRTHSIIKVDTDDTGAGDHRLLDTEIKRANEYKELGYKVYSIYEEASETDEETVRIGIDASPYIMGYFVEEK